METEARFTLEGFNIVLYGKFISDSPILFLLFFIWSVNCLRDFFCHFVVSKLHGLSFWIIEHASEMSHNVSINLFLRPCSIAIYGKFYLYCFYHLRLFRSVNYLLLFGSVKIHKHCLYWNGVSTDINGKMIFNYLLLFKSILLVSKLCESSHQLQQFFSDMLRNWGKV